MNGSVEQRQQRLLWRRVLGEESKSAKLRREFRKEKSALQYKSCGCICLQTTAAKCVAHTSIGKMNIYFCRLKVPLMELFGRSIYRSRENIATNHPMCTNAMKNYCLLIRKSRFSVSQLTVRWRRYGWYQNNSRWNGWRKFCPRSLRRESWSCIPVLVLLPLPRHVCSCLITAGFLRYEKYFACVLISLSLLLEKCPKQSLSVDSDTTRSQEVVAPSKGFTKMMVALK